MNEQTILQVLRNLPISVQLTPDYTSESGGYSWQCLDGSGKSRDLAAALSESLTFLIEQIAGDASVLDDLRTVRGVVQARKKREGRT